jgi:uncharacterized protein (DUF3084 family)
MADNTPQSDKMSGWLRSVAGIFVKLEDAPEAPAAAPATAPTSAPSAAPTVPTSEDFVQDLQNRFRKLLEEKNQPGFDFYEFSMMLLRSSAAPTPDQFQTAFEGAKLMNPQCSPSVLLESANFYKKELQVAFQNTIQAGEQKKQTLVSDKAKEQQQLQQEVGQLDTKIQQLRQQLATLEESRQVKVGDLQNIDSRYEGKLQEVAQKMAATQVAKEGLLSEMTLIEQGIRQLK